MRHTSERPLQIAAELQSIARRASVFGSHVHVGVGSGDRAVAIVNAMLPALPMLLALSANSPFCDGQDSGLMSMRRQVLASMPRTGLPQPITSWAQWIEWSINYVLAVMWQVFATSGGMCV